MTPLGWFLAGAWVGLALLPPWGTLAALLIVAGMGVGVWRQDRRAR